MLKRAFGYLLMLCSLLLSCSKEPPKDNWQKAQWDKCSQELQKHLDSKGREEPMSTLDAAYVAILMDNGDWSSSRTLPFTVDGDPCQAVLTREGDRSSLLVLRNSREMGRFTLDGDAFYGESAGIRLESNPLIYNANEVRVNATFKAEDVLLASLKMDGPMDKVDVTVDLITGISIRGDVDASSLWEALRGITDASTKDEAVAFVEKGASAIHLNVYYEGDLTTPHAIVTLVPEHILSRYDDYWTWNAIIQTETGEALTQVKSSLGLLFDGTLPFYQAWKSLMPHIIS